jgi:hypothetical protein
MATQIESEYNLDDNQDDQQTDQQSDWQTDRQSNRQSVYFIIFNLLRLKSVSNLTWLFLILSPAQIRQRLGLG